MFEIMIPFFFLCPYVRAHTPKSHKMHRACIILHDISFSLQLPVVAEPSASRDGKASWILRIIAWIIRSHQFKP